MSEREPKVNRLSDEQVGRIIYRFFDHLITVPTAGLSPTIRWMLRDAVDEELAWRRPQLNFREFIGSLVSDPGNGFEREQADIIGRTRGLIERSIL